MPKGKQSLAEIEDTPEVLAIKVKELAKLLTKSKHCVVFTGAGISTAANIPDYRGPNGVWTLAYQNKTVDRKVDMIRSQPTFTHMFLKELYKAKKIDHILSQNCDGLHLRSGMPQSSLSEVHGNMFVEVCTNCQPNIQYIRPFDCTIKSEFKQHKTDRKCDICENFLEDTIVHFGEKGKHGWPLNWPGTHCALDKADLIICMGTSLNVLRHYKVLWPDPDEDVKLVIINLQWTAKDRAAFIKINGKCDDVMRQLSVEMGFEPTPYCRNCDPVLSINENPQPDLMSCVTDCFCGNPIEELAGSSDAEADNELAPEQPGWWAAEIARMKTNTPKAKSPSPEASCRKSFPLETNVLVNGPVLRKRKGAKGGRKKKILESNFEKDVRLTVIDLVNSFDDEPYEEASTLRRSSRRTRGRPKKYYPLSIEKEGSFKFLGEEPIHKPVPTKRRRPPDFDFDAKESGSENDSDESCDGDPSFTIPKQMLANTFWSGPGRKKRGESGESKEWDLLPKRTRKSTDGYNGKGQKMIHTRPMEDAYTDAAHSNTPSNESVGSDEQHADIPMAYVHQAQIRVREEDLSHDLFREIIIEEDDFLEIPRNSPIGQLDIVDHEEIVDEDDDTKSGDTGDGEVIEEEVIEEETIEEEVIEEEVIEEVVMDNVVIDGEIIEEELIDVDYVEEYGEDEEQIPLEQYEGNPFDVEPYPQEFFDGYYPIENGENFQEDFIENENAEGEFQNNIIYVQDVQTPAQPFEYVLDDDFYDQFQNITPRVIDNFPPDFIIEVNISGKVKDKALAHKRYIYLFEAKLLHRFRDALFANDWTLLNGVCFFFKNNNDNKKLEVLSAKEIIAIARRLRDGRNVLNDSVIFSLHKAGPNSTVLTSGAVVLHAEA